MKIQSKDKDAFASSMIVKLHNRDWLDKQRVAGKVVAATLTMLENEVKNKTKLSLLDLNNVAEEFIISQGCQLTFKGYKGFPAGVCISVNKQLVHGIPTNYLLQEGDVVSFDLGATYQGAIADSALTCIYGDPKSDRHIELVKTTEEALMEGIAAIKIGNRLGCIGNAIFKCGRSHGFSIIDKYGGHGISWNTPHSSPFVANRADYNEGIRIQPGLSIAIEPLFVLGSSNATKTDADGWTVMTDDISSHFEHTLYIHEDKVEIITQR